MRTTAVAVCACALVLVLGASALPCSADLTLMKVGIDGDLTEFFFEVTGNVSTSVGLQHLETTSWHFGHTFHDELKGNGVVVTITEDNIPAGWQLADILFTWGVDPAVTGANSAFATYGDDSITITLFDHNWAKAVFVNEPYEVPEPATYGLFALGLAGIFVIRRRRRR